MAHSSKAGDEYPPHVSAPSLVTVKLSGRGTYDVWKTQMLCLLKSHDMLSFISPEAEHAQTQSGKEIVGEYWRSDAMVKVWILGSLSQETLKYVVKPNKDLSTAREIWEQLRTIYGPNPLLAERRKTLLEYMGNEKEKKVGKAQAELLLYDATIAHDFLSVERILSEKVITLSEKITISGNTALHLAVATTKKNWEFLQKMLNLATKDNLKLLDVRNSQGSTLLHVAAIIGDTEAAKMLVEKDKTLLYAKDNEDQTPVAKALSRNTDTYQYLRGCSIKHRDIELGDIGHSELLVNIISSKDHKSAYSLLEKTNGLPKETDIVLMAIAQNFPPKLNFWERIVSAVPDLLKFKFVESVKRKAEAYHYAVRLLDIICTYSVRKGTTPRLYLDFFNNAILEATRQNAEEFVRTIMGYFPTVIWSVNEDGHNIIQYAVLNRSQKVYILLYRMIENKNFYRTLKDPLGNNLLHLAAKLAPPEKLSHISGAALQIQRELQWFKEVEEFISPLNIIQKNCFGETPQMVFTREHKELVTEGEKWMKDAAESYTITAALITTIVFAAAITVPGGNKQDNGIPMFANKAAFTIFAVSDAVSLFTSVTSLLMFLAILTARFSEQDFLFKLPTKLIIGLVTLFISTTAMIVAFGATLFLVFGHNNALILVPIAVLTCLPITTFMTLQFPLIYDLISRTYGRSIFSKKSRRPLYYFFAGYPIW